MALGVRLICAWGAGPRVQQEGWGARPCWGRQARERQAHANLSSQIIKIRIVFWNYLKLQFQFRCTSFFCNCIFELLWKFMVFVLFYIFVVILQKIQKIQKYKNHEIWSNSKLQIRKKYKCNECENTISNQAKQKYSAPLFFESTPFWNYTRT